VFVGDRRQGRQIQLAAVAQLTVLGAVGEVRGDGGELDLASLPSVTDEHAPLPAE